MAAYMNIAGTTAIDDPEYRYKMPRLQTKIEGRGNGIKTLVVNCNDIAASLHRSTGEVNKFFGCELGAQSKYDEKTDRALVNGAFETNAMQQHLSKYIELFVLCPKCRLPETKYKFKGQCIYHKCNACGAIEPVDMNHRLTTFILKEHAAARRQKKGRDTDKKEKRKAKKHHRPENEESNEETRSNHSSEEKKVSKPKKDKESTKHKTKKSVKKDSTGSGGSHADSEDQIEMEAEEEIKWHTDLSREAVAARKHEAESLDPANKTELNGMTKFMETMDIQDAASLLESSVGFLKAFLQESKHTSSEIIEEIIRQQTFRALAVTDRLAMFVFAALDENLVANNQIVQYADVLRHLVLDSESQCRLIGVMEEFCTSVHRSLLPSFAIILKLYYDEDMIDEEVLLTWPQRRDVYGCKTMSKQDKDYTQKALSPFIEWLKNAEEEEDEDEDEDGEKE